MWYRPGLKQHINLCLFLAGASLQGVESFAKQLFRPHAEFADQSAPEAASADSVKLQAAFLSSMAGIAADAVLAKPAVGDTSRPMPATERAGPLMSLLMSAGGSFYAQQQATERQPREVGGNVNGTPQEVTSKESDSATVLLAQQDAEMEAAVQHCLQVCFPC